MKPEFWDNIKYFSYVWEAEVDKVSTDKVVDIFLTTRYKGKALLTGGSIVFF